MAALSPLAMAGISAGATAARAGLQAIPTKFEREQKKRLAELQRKQEMGLLGLTEAERAQIESQLRGPREQAQRRSDAEICTFKQSYSTTWTTTTGSTVGCRGSSTYGSKLGQSVAWYGHPTST